MFQSQQMKVGLCVYTHLKWIFRKVCIHSSASLRQTHTLLKDDDSTTVDVFCVSYSSQHAVSGWMKPAVSFCAETVSGRDASAGEPNETENKEFHQVNIFRHIRKDALRYYIQWIRSNIWRNWYLSVYWSNWILCFRIMKQKLKNRRWGEGFMTESSIYIYLSIYIYILYSI